LSHLGLQVVAYLRELDAIARVSGHTNTIAFYDSGEDSYGRPYLVTEHAAGGDLSDRIAQAQDHPIALGEVLQIAADVASALDHVHSCGIVHRDVKPENLWLTSDGDIKLGDFVSERPDAAVMAHLYSLPDAPSRRRADVPPALDELVLSLLEKAPENRPQAATDVAGALAAIRPLSRPVSLVRRLGRKGRSGTLRVAA
jgi:serine/threonine protein kinase